MFYVIFYRNATWANETIINRLMYKNSLTIRGYLADIDEIRLL